MSYSKKTLMTQDKDSAVLLELSPDGRSRRKLEGWELAMSCSVRVVDGILKTLGGTSHFLKTVIVFRITAKDKHIFTTVTYKDAVTFAGLGKSSCLAASQP